MSERRNGTRPHFVRLNSKLTMGHDAFTLGCVTFVRAETCSAELRAHENRHVQQLFRYYVLGFWFLYLVDYAWQILLELLTGNFKTTLNRAYHHIRFERDAYRWASEHWQEFDPLP